MDIPTVKYEIERFLLGGQFELLEDGNRLAGVEAERCLAEVSYGKLILSAWGDGWSKSWRVLNAKCKANSLVIQWSRHVGLKTGILELRRGEKADAVQLTRQDFPEWIKNRIEQDLPAFSVERAVMARNDRRHLSGVYTRLVLRHRQGPAQKAVAGIAVGPSETQPVIDAVLGSGVIWMEELRESVPATERLVIFVPVGAGRTIATRLTAFSMKSGPISLYEYDVEEEELKAVAPYDQGDLADNFRNASRTAVWPIVLNVPSDLQNQIDAVVRIAPDFIETRFRGNSAVLSIRGLDFAVARIGQQRISFGVDGSQRRLTTSNWGQLSELISRIIDCRSPNSTDSTSQLYRAYSERWLESVLKRQAQVLDPDINPEFVYSQVPTYRGEQRTFMDLLTVTRGGRLVIMELKVIEDPDFPLQALDYWLRVEWHRSRDDFQRRGYFSGVEISDEPPLLYMVAPLFCFHATTSLIAGCISDRIPLYRIGINNDWRGGVRVLLREKLN